MKIGNVLAIVIITLVVAAIIFVAISSVSQGLNKEEERTAQFNENMEMGRQGAEYVYYMQTKENAEKGDAEAQCDLGLFYMSKKDFVRAAFWYTQSAKQGYVEAQIKLGECYEHGFGVDKDEQTAIYWYKKAAEKGSTEALKRLDNLNIHYYVLPNN